MRSEKTAFLLTFLFGMIHGNPSLIVKAYFFALFSLEWSEADSVDVRRAPLSWRHGDCHLSLPARSFSECKKCAYVCMRVYVLCVLLTSLCVCLRLYVCVSLSLCGVRVASLCPSKLCDYEYCPFAAVCYRCARDG